jgi:MFS family permease
MRRTQIYSLYAIAFLLNLHIALPAYINSTFLSEFIPEQFVGLVYTLSSVFALIGLIYWPQIIRIFGNYKLSIINLVLGFLAMIALVIFKIPLIIFISLATSLALGRLLIFNNDIFLENLSTDNETGNIRGFFLSASNFAWVISPILAALILGDNQYSRLYLITAILAIPVILIFRSKFRNFKDPQYDKVPFWGTVKEIFARKDIKRVIMINVLLRVFYALMVIYTPIYLHEHIGFEWNEIGLIFTMMLLPFVLLEIPLGRIADQILGEKELLIAGFLIIALSTAYLSFITEANVLVWAIALFLTRVGASILEVMSETYFFKKIDGKDSNLLSFFRMTGPLSYIISPLIATAIIPLIGIQYIFLVLGLVMFLGLKYSYNLKDTL